jgi:four helix bundle protein
MNSYRDLKAWQFGMEVAEEVYDITADFPKRLQFSLANQIERAATSIPSNISEGYCRRTKKDQTQFYFVARGSLAELETQLILSTHKNFMTRETMQNLWPKLQELGKIINGLIRANRE